MSLRINPDRCNLCLRCLERCPFDALVEGARAVRAGEACTLCGACVEACPTEALALASPAPETRGGTAAGDRGGVWIYGEHHEGHFHPVVFELIGRGAALARTRGCRLEVVALGRGLEGLREHLRGYPVDALRLVEHPDLADYRDGPHAGALARLIRRRGPEIVLAGATARGRSLIPRVAVLCHTGLTADCTGLEIDPEEGHMLQTRPAFGGNLMATIATRRHRPQMATVRPRVMQRPEPAGDRLPQLRRWAAPDDALADGMTVVRRTEHCEEGVNIAEARVLVAGGRGVDGAEGFEALAELARVLGGELAASRAAVDAGWAPYARQVGQTGKTVQPDLYVAVGISGAVQHRAGMQSSGTIVAVNTDRQAAIFDLADYGIVGDWRQVLPHLLRELRARGGRGR